MIFPQLITSIDFEYELNYDVGSYAEPGLKSIDLESGGSEVFDFGRQTRGVIETTIKFIRISKGNYTALFEFLLSKVGGLVEVQLDNPLFGDPYDQNLTDSVYLQEIAPNNEEAFSKDGAYVITATFRYNLPDNDQLEVGARNVFDFLVDINLNTWSADNIVPDIAARDALTPVLRETSITESPRKIWVWNGTIWSEVFPFKPWEVTAYFELGADLVDPNGLNQNAFVNETQQYFTSIEDGNGGFAWSATAFPDIRNWKPIVLNNPLIGLHNGSMYWSSFTEVPIAQSGGTDLRPANYTPGFIAKGGIDWPATSYDVSKGPGVETLVGFKVKVVNANEFHKETYTNNFYGARISLSVYDELGADTFTVRTGEVKTSDFRETYTIAAAPSLWIDADKNLPSKSIGEIYGVDGGDSDRKSIQTFGKWKYAKLQTVVNDSGVLFGGQSFQITTVSANEFRVPFETGVFINFTALVVSLNSKIDGNTV
ncbi:MAG: hypothetical protein KAS32_15655, partial [Candidatus Peribacteraceae bacterium]|nr:hypothetical protein [Candidatus Peribacteraceae bacterium]